MFFNNDAEHERKIYFLTKEQQISLIEPSDILLSPEYYWIKRVHLPVTSRYQAQKLAKSIFEDHLPNSEGYRFIVSATDIKGSFIILAYHPDEIKKRLKKQINDPAKIRKVYFSQFAFVCTQSCIAIDARSALQCVDGVILYIPVTCQDRDAKSLTELLQRIPKMRYYIYLYDDEQISEKSVRQTLLFFLLLFAAYGAEIGWHLFKKREIESAQQRIAKRYDMPTTMMQYNSIVKRLEKTESRQRHKRRLLRIVSHLPAKEETFKLEKLSLSEDRLKLYWRQTDTKTEKTILDYLARNASIRKVSHKEGLSEVVIR